jgi:RNA polymerase sigma-70 factor (ECF subfamily)
MDSLVVRILQGDSQAVAQFYAQYVGKIRTYLKNRLPVSEDIEAFTNDIFLEAIDGLPLFEGKSSLQTWLYRIAHNTLVDWYRKKKINALLLSQLPFLEIIAQEVYQPEFQYEKNRIRDRIELTLRSLSSKYRQILQLHYEEQKSVKEIALILNLSAKATESLLFRARQEFKKTYEKG